MINRIIIVAVILLFASSFIFAGCGACGMCRRAHKEKIKSHEGDTHSPEMHGTKTEDSGSMKMKMGGSSNDILTAEKLYTCPMHPDVVTANAETPCPLCNMKLKEMPAEKVKELRDSHPKGCAMCSIAVKGNSKLEDCPGCKMKLSAIEMPDDAKKQ